MRFEMMAAATRDDSRRRAAGGFQLERELQPIHALLKRWATWKALFDPQTSLPTPAPEIAHLDAVIESAPRETRMLLDIWYRTDEPADLKARRYGVSRAGMYTHLRAALWFARGAMGSDHGFK